MTSKVSITKSKDLMTKRRVLNILGENQCLKLKYFLKLKSNGNRVDSNVDLTLRLS